MESKQLRVVSWNVDGIGTEICNIPKLKHVLEELTRNGAEIVFLQETHIGSKNYRTLLDNDNETEWKCFFTVYDSRSKGVAILIRENIPFQYLCHDEDYSGGYLVLFCHLYGKLFTLVNVYNHKNDKDMLNRLQEYLRETAEGVLLVGGDFNTVLDLSFDKESASEKLHHTPLWKPLKKFTASLNLLDTWAYRNHTVKKFTCLHGNASSRLDMFLLPEDIIERVSDIKISEPKMIVNSKGNERNISDHKPLVINLTLSEQTSKTGKPEVAAWSDNYMIYIRDESSGKINGAEILSVIKSLTDSGQQYSDGNSLQDYKKSCCAKTEILKIDFNRWLKCEAIPEQFKQHTSNPTGASTYLNLDCLIFTMILAKRLKMLLVAFPEKNCQNNTDYCYCLAFSEKPTHIRWAFLTECLLNLYKICKSAKVIPLRDFNILEGLVHSSTDLKGDFRILERILPKSSNSSDDIRELQEGCPLTRAILSLVLKHLEIEIKKQNYITNICHYRQVIAIGKVQLTSPVDQILKNFIESSGIKMEFLKNDSS